MANANEKARAAVALLFKKNPGATTTEFQEAAVKHDPSIKKDDARSFHARYVLSHKRAASAGKKKVKKTAKKTVAKKKPVRRRARRKTAARRVAGISDSQRTALRQLVLARDKQVVATLTGSNAQEAYELAAELDSYIDQLMAAAQSR
jgi:hypothetical protein